MPPTNRSPASATPLSPAPPAARSILPWLDGLLTFVRAQIVQVEERIEFREKEVAGRRPEAAGKPLEDFHNKADYIQLRFWIMSEVGLSAAMIIGLTTYFASFVVLLGLKAFPAAGGLALLGLPVIGTIGSLALRRRSKKRAARGAPAVEGAES